MSRPSPPLNDVVLPETVQPKLVAMPSLSFWETVLPETVDPVPTKRPRKPFWLAMLSRTVERAPAKTPSVRFQRRWTSAISPAVPTEIPVLPIPTTLPLRTETPFAVDVVVWTPNPEPDGGVQSKVAPWQPERTMAKPFRSSLTSLAVTWIAVVFASGTTRSPVSR